MKKFVLAIVAGLALVPMASSASQAGSFEFGVYGGVGESFDSDVTSTVGGNTVTNKDVEWDGDSFGPAPYWGARLTYWPSSLPRWGFMLDYTHAKLIADPATIDASYSRLEFTDGLNLVTANAVYKFEDVGRFKPYAGAGIGLSIPHVEVRRNGSTTHEYQVTGVALQGLIGAKYDLNDSFAVFSEYKLSYADIEADLSGGGSFESEAITNHFVFGLSYKFGNR